MKKSLVIAISIALMLVFGTTAAIADTVAYDFEGSDQGWVVDTSAFYGANIKSLTPSSAQSQGGTGSIAVAVDVDEKKPLATPPYISDVINVGPSPAANLTGYTSVRAYIYVPANSVILDTNPLNMSVYVKTGTLWKYFTTNTDQTVNIDSSNFGTWVPVEINLSLAQDDTGLDGQIVTDINDVKEFGVSYSGCGVATGDGNTATADITTYVDSITYIGAAASTDITVTVQGVTLGVSITGTVDFGNVQMGSQTVSTNALVVTNTGSTAETFSLSLVNPSVWTAVNTTPGNETYVLGAIFNTGGPAIANFIAPEDSVIDLPRQCTSTVFAGNATGTFVPMGVSKDLWLLFKAPVQTSSTTQQSIRLIVSAEQS
ncbi:MAG: hypothetical protein ABH868_07710 [bacterium]